MRIAVAYENGQVYQHFGQTERFMIYDTENGKVSIKTLINTNGKRHGALADILKKISVDTVLCGKLGDGAQRAIAEAGITLYSGVSGDVDKAVNAFLRGELARDLNAICEHRGTHRAESLSQSPPSAAQLKQ